MYVRFPDYAAAFEENEIRGSSLRDLDKSDLKVLGVRKLGHQIDILKAIKSLMETEQVPSSSLFCGKCMIGRFGSYHNCIVMSPLLFRTVMDGVVLLQHQSAVLSPPLDHPTPPTQPRGPTALSAPANVPVFPPAGSAESGNTSSAHTRESKPTRSALMASPASSIGAASSSVNQRSSATTPQLSTKTCQSTSTAAATMPLALLSMPSRCDMRSCEVVLACVLSLSTVGVRVFLTFFFCGKFMPRGSILTYFCCVFAVVAVAFSASAKLLAMFSPPVCLTSLLILLGGLWCFGSVLITLVCLQGS